MAEQLIAHLTEALRDEQLSEREKLTACQLLTRIDGASLRLFESLAH